MERQARDFKGVWIPKEIWCSDQLSLIEKVLFVEIHSLDNERGCYLKRRYSGGYMKAFSTPIRSSDKIRMPATGRQSTMRS